MANIKSFNLAGVGPQVQFGKGGLQIAQDSGAFAFRDHTNTTLVNVEVATPISASHAASMAYVENLINTLTATQIAFDNTTSQIPSSPTTVQAAINAVIANGNAHIRDNNASPKAQVATDEVSGSVTVDVSNGTTGSRIVTFTGGAASDSSLNIHNEVSGAVNIDAYSATATDVNVYINPQGNGKVYIGNNSADSELQGDDGQSLTLAGGDNTALNGNAGNLILKAGHASNGGADGNVVVQDGAGNAILTFVETASADTSASLANGIGKTTLSVSSSTETNADLYLAPLGTGAVNVSGANIHNVADPVNATDGANKEYVDAQVAAASSAATSALVGSFRNEVSTISTASANLSASIKGEVRNVTVMIQTPYVGAGAVTIQIGTVGNPTLITDGSTLDETTAGMYPIVCSAIFAVATQLIVTINGSPSAGAARVLIDYVQG